MELILDYLEDEGVIYTTGQSLLLYLTIASCVEMFNRIMLLPI